MHRQFAVHEAESAFATNADNGGSDRRANCKMEEDILASLASGSWLKLANHRRIFASESKVAHHKFSEIKIAVPDTWTRNVIAFVRDTNTGEHVLSIVGDGRVFRHLDGRWIGYCQHGRLYDLSRRFSAF
jgi:hypothetical protein